MYVFKTLSAILLPACLLTACGARTWQSTQSDMSSVTASQFFCPQKIMLSGFHTKGTSDLVAAVKGANVVPEALDSEIKEALDAKRGYDLTPGGRIALSPVPVAGGFCEVQFPDGGTSSVFLERDQNDISLVLNGGVPENAGGDLKAIEGRNIAKRPLDIFMTLDFPTGSQAPVVKIGTISVVDIELRH